MIHYRPFLNWDPLAIAEIWRHQPPQPGRMQPVTSGMLEELVFAKPYFDREGFIVAVDGAKPLGFVHATLGSTVSGSAVDPSIGVIAMLLTEPTEKAPEITLELLAAGVDYLRKKGATTIRIGSAPPHDPFYLGLYGGALPAGILSHDELLVAALLAERFVPTQRWHLWRRTLADFRPPIDRQQRQLRLKYEVAATSDPATTTWWEACQWGHVVRTRYDLVPRGGGAPLASCLMWDIVPLSRTWGRQAAGFIRWQDSGAQSIPGATTYFCAEIMFQLQQDQVAIAAAATHDGEHDLCAMFHSLGYEEYANGAIYERME